MLRFIRQSLSSLYSEREANKLAINVLQHVTNLSQAAILTCKDTVLSENERQKIEQIVARLQKSEPLEYILGKTEFYGLSFCVSPDVLIPRPETEELVDWIIRDTKHPAPRILDIGTGSGCIAVALAKNIENSNVFAIDISENALEIARKNAEINNVNVEFFRKDIFKAPSMGGVAAVPPPKSPIEGGFRGDFNIIVSNPPYVCESEKADIEANVLLYEPHTALFVPNENPLVFYRAIANFALTHLSGSLYFEINRAFGQEICTMLGEMGFSDIELRKDNYGNNRMIKCNSGI